MKLFHRIDIFKGWLPLLLCSFILTKNRQAAPQVQGDVEDLGQKISAKLLLRLSLSLYLGPQIIIKLLSVYIYIYILSSLVGKSIRRCKNDRNAEGNKRQIDKNRGP